MYSRLWETTLTLTVAGSHHQWSTP